MDIVQQCNVHCVVHCAVHVVQHRVRRTVCCMHGAVHSVLHAPLHVPHGPAWPCMARTACTVHRPRFRPRRIFREDNEIVTKGNMRHPATGKQLLPFRYWPESFMPEEVRRI